MEQPMVSESSTAELHSSYRRTLAKLKYEERVNLAVKIAKPMAPENLTMKLRDLILAAWNKKTLDIGAKACLKQLLKKEEKGILVIPGDVSPIDSVTHLQGICLDEKKPYCYVPTRYDLGVMFCPKISVNCLYIRHDAEYKNLFNDCLKNIRKLPEP